MNIIPVEVTPSLYISLKKISVATYKHADVTLLRLNASFLRFMTQCRPKIFKCDFLESETKHESAQGLLIIPLIHYPMEQRVLLEKLTDVQLVKNFAAFYVTRRFTTAFKNARHLPLS